MQALKAASQQPEASLAPTDPPSPHPSPPHGTPGHTPLHPQQITPTKHIPSAEQLAILALTGNSKATAREAAVTVKPEQQLQQQLQQQQLQQQLQEQLPHQQHLSVSAAGEGGTKGSGGTTRQQHMQVQDEGLSGVHRQLSQEFEREESPAESVSEEAEIEVGSIEVCPCLLFLALEGTVCTFLPCKHSPFFCTLEACAVEQSLLFKATDPKSTPFLAR